MVDVGALGAINAKNSDHRAIWTYFFKAFLKLVLKKIILGSI
jgi:hypothetical protein